MFSRFKYIKHIFLILLIQAVVVIDIILDDASFGIGKAEAVKLDTINLNKSSFPLQKNINIHKINSIESPAKIYSLNHQFEKAPTVFEKIYSDLKYKPKDLEDEFVKAAEKHTIDPNLLISICYNESRFKDKVVSHAGAVGICQIIPKWHKTTKNEMLDYKKNIDKAAKYISKLHEICNDNLKCVIQSYNVGDGAYRKGIRNNHYEKIVMNEMKKIKDEVINGNIEISYRD